jgi:hypothetical protein
MAYTPLVIEPEYVRMAGFHQDLSVGGGAFYASVLAQRRDVSKLAQDLIWDAIHGNTPAERLGTRLGWNFMTADNVPGFSPANYLIQAPPVGLDPQLIVKVRGGLAGTPGKVSTEVEYGTAPLADRVVVTLEGGIFESNDEEDDADLIFWWGLFAVGLALGMGHASDDRDIMFPRFRGEVDSLGPNLFASECNMDAINALVLGPPATPAVVCGGASMPPADPIPGAVSCTSNQTFYMDGETAVINVEVDDTTASDLSNALVKVCVTGANGKEYLSRGVSDGSGEITTNIQVGGAFGIGNYTMTPSVVAGGVEVLGATKTIFVDD